MPITLPNHRHRAAWPVEANTRGRVPFLSVYEQIARNKRRAVVYVLLFFVVWLGIGALVGWIAAGTSTSSGGTAYRTTPPATTTTTHYAGAVIAGMVVAGLVALAAIAYSLRSGARLVLAVSGARPADPHQYQQLHDIVEALAIGDGLPKPAVAVIADP